MGADPRAELIAVARDFHGRGWMSGTAGNLSARQGSEVWITASGRAKGRLVPADFLRLDASGHVCFGEAGARPSAETSLHLAVYRLFPEAAACLHVHSVASCLAASRSQGGRLRLPPLEMLKAFGLWTQDPEVDLAVFANHLEVPHIADEVGAAFAQQAPAVPAFMIQNHGTTVWGESVEQAYHRVEALEFLLEYLARSARCD